MIKQVGQFFSYDAISRVSHGLSLKIFDEIQYFCNVDIEANFRSMIPKLLTNMPDSSGFVNGK